jgi:predicted dehydrogenase
MAVQVSLPDSSCSRCCKNRIYYLCEWYCLINVYSEAEIKILIAGLGSIGRRHLRNLSSLGERDIILYRTGHATLQDDELSAFPVEVDLMAALAERPDAVIVSNPTSLHLDVAIPAAEAGCHLLIEKPISNSMQRVAELAEAARRGGAKILVGFQFRFHPGLQRVAKLLEEEAIGRPISARSSWGEYLPSWHPWEDYRQGYSARSDLGGGVILTLSHPLDYLLWFFGQVHHLWAMTGKIGDLELPVEDTAEIALRFQNGVLGSVHLDYNRRPAAHHLEIVGTDGVIQWDNVDGAVRIYRVSDQRWKVYAPPQGFERNDMFLAQMRHFLAVARSECQPVCNLEDGVVALEIALKALESAQQGIMLSVNPQGQNI